MEEKYPDQSGLITLMYTTYILYSSKFDRYYIGHTNNLSFRIWQHNSGKMASTKPYRTWQAVYTEDFYTRSEATKREKFLKSLKDKNFIKRLTSESPK